MVQTISTHVIPAGEKMIVVDKPLKLQRIFFSVYVVASQASWYDVKISFDDPLFHSYYALNGPKKYFEATGEDIFQGNVWVINQSDVGLLFSVTEILH